MQKSWWMWLIHSLLGLFVTASSIWVCLLLWVHKPFGALGTYAAMGL